jgi:cell division protein FtsQ
VKNQAPQNRPSLWEDEPLAEPQFRRVRQIVSPGERPAAAGRRASDRVLPGMPLEFDDPEDDDPALSRPRLRYDEPRGSWWRPKSKAGRIFLGLGAVLVLGGLTAAGLTLKTYLSRDARFRIRGTENIQATGLTEVSRAEMLPVFGEDVGRNVFFVPLTERRKQLEQLPWVEHATVMRLLPDQIRVDIVERQPVAFTRNGNQIGLVDANGVLLSMSAAAMARHHFSFPVLTGIDPGDPAEARKARLAVYLRLMTELDSTGQHNSEQISEIDLTDPEDARVLMPEQGRDILAHFGEDHFLERYQRYKAHIAEWRQQYPNLASADLRYDQQVVLQMSSGKQTADTATGDSTSGDAKPAEAQTADSGTSAKTDKPANKSAIHAKPSAGSAAVRKKALLEKKRAEARRAALKAHKAAAKPAARNAKQTATHSSRSAALSQGG